MTRVCPAICCGAVAAQWWVLAGWFGWWSCVAWAWDQGLQGLPGLVERLLGIDAELACLDREAVSGRRQALVALCRGWLGWCVQDEAAVPPATSAWPPPPSPASTGS